MSKSPKIKRITAFSTFLNFKIESYPIDIPNHKAFPDQINYESGNGYYWGKSRCVKIYYVGPYNTRKEQTTRLEVRINGMEYERTYYRKFTDRGLCMISSRLIRDAEILHKKRK